MMLSEDEIALKRASHYTADLETSLQHARSVIEKHRANESLLQGIIEMVWMRCHQKFYEHSRPDDLDGDDTETINRTIDAADLKRELAKHRIGFGNYLKLQTKK